MKTFYRILFAFFYCSLLFSKEQTLAKFLTSHPDLEGIPKIIHQIWVGKNKMHPRCKKAIETWKALHPDWEYKLWTDDDVDDFPWTNKELFLKANNPGTKSDVWRYEIINTYGGLYADVDFICLKPFDLFHDKLSFYSGFIGLMSEYTVANGLFASCPNHPILNSIISGLTELKYKNAKDTSSYIMTVTGQEVFTKCISDYNNLWKDRSLINKNCYIFSTSVFYPIKPYHWKKMHANDLVIPHEYEWLLENAYAVHLYARSWIKED